MVASNIGTQFGDTSKTKIFVGGLPWETKTDTMRRYFEQFGEILEAVVISDKVTGRSKGYGFVTFKDPESAARACENGSPVIDGRRANCNLAALGAQKTHTTKTPQTQDEFEGLKKLRTSSGPIISSSTYLHPQYNPQYSFPYSIYRFPYYQQGNFTYPMNCNGYAYGGGGHVQHYSNYAVGIGSPTPAGMYYSSYHPLYFYPVQTLRPISATAESVTGKHQQLPPRIHRLKYGTEQVPCQNLQ